MLSCHLHQEIAVHLTSVEQTLLWGEFMPILHTDEINVATPAMFRLCLTRAIPAARLVSHILCQVNLNYALFSYPGFAPYLYPPSSKVQCYYNILVQYHRPLCFLEYYSRLYPHVFRDTTSTHFCIIAVRYNNVMVLRWLRDSTLGVGQYDWTAELCTIAAGNGNCAMLQRLRDPTLDGGICPWSSWACVAACENGHLKALCWLRNPNTGNGTCPWTYQYCLVIARQNKHQHIVNWMSTQAP